MAIAIDLHHQPTVTRIIWDTDRNSLRLTCPNGASMHSMRSVLGFVQKAYARLRQAATGFPEEAPKNFMPAFSIEGDDLVLSQVDARVAVFVLSHVPDIVYFREEDRSFQGRVKGGTKAADTEMKEAIDAVGLKPVREYLERGVRGLKSAGAGVAG